MRNGKDQIPVPVVVSNVLIKLRSEMFLVMIMKVRIRFGQYGLDWEMKS